MKHAKGRRTKSNSFFRVGKRSGNKGKDGRCRILKLRLFGLRTPLQERVTQRTGGRCRKGAMSRTAIEDQKPQCRDRHTGLSNAVRGGGEKNREEEGRGGGEGEGTSNRSRILASGKGSDMPFRVREGGSSRADIYKGRGKKGKQRYEQGLKVLGTGWAHRSAKNREEELD